MNVVAVVLSVVLLLSMVTMEPQMPEPLSVAPDQVSVGRAEAT